MVYYLRLVKLAKVLLGFGWCVSTALFLLINHIVSKISPVYGTICGSAAYLSDSVYHIFRRRSRRSAFNKGLGSVLS